MTFSFSVAISNDKISFYMREKENFTRREEAGFYMVQNVIDR